MKPCKGCYRSFCPWYLLTRVSAGPNWGCSVPGKATCSAADESLATDASTWKQRPGGLSNVWQPQPPQLQADFVSSKWPRWLGCFRMIAISVASKLELMSLSVDFLGNFDVAMGKIRLVVPAEGWFLKKSRFREAALWQTDLQIFGGRSWCLVPQGFGGRLKSLRNNLGSYWVNLFNFFVYL